MIQFVEIDPAKMLAETIAREEAYYAEQGDPITLLPGDERYLFLAQQVQEIVAIRQQINLTANKNLLRNMTGTLLDEYGDQYDVPRLEAQRATVRMKFLLTTALAFDVPIVRGLRVTPDGTYNFLVLADSRIVAGETSAEVDAVAELPGRAYNGFLPGQIKNIVDVNLAGNLSGAVNVTASTGGSDRESDERYRERIPQRWEGISTCGSEEGYAYWARTASSEIVDVKPIQISAGEVTVYVLLRGAAEPSETLLALVDAAVSAKKRRPLTDSVTISGAQIKHYTINLTYYINRVDAADEVRIKAAVEAAVRDFAAEQMQHLGGNLNPDSLRRGILSAGGYRIDITTPVFTALLPQEVAVVGTIDVSYGGMLS